MCFEENLIKKKKLFTVTFILLKQIFNKKHKSYLMIKDEEKTRPPETLNCSTSKMWRPRKLKLHKPVSGVLYPGKGRKRCTGRHLLC